MKIDKLSKSYLADFDVDEINDLLNEIGACESVVGFVDIEEDSQLYKSSGKLCMADNGDYINLVYYPFIIPEKDLNSIIEDSEKVWKFLNDNDEDTPYLKTIIIQDCFLDDEDEADTPDGVKFNNSNYYVSKYSMRNFSSFKKYCSVRNKMSQSSRKKYFKDFPEDIFYDMDLNEVNGLLELFDVGEEIEEFVELEFDEVDPDIDLDCYVGINKNGEYLIVKLIMGPFDDKLRDELGLTCYTIDNILRKENDDVPILKPIVIDMGANMRDSCNII